MIYIAKNYKGQVISIISASTISEAKAYWQGKGITPHTEDEFDQNISRDNEDNGYVTPILETKQIELSKFGANPQTFIVVL